MATYDPSQLAELRHLVVAMATDIDETRAAGYRTLYSGDELRAHFRILVRTAGLKAALTEVRERYRLQLAGDLLPLGAGVPQTGPSSEPGGGW